LPAALPRRVLVIGRSGQLARALARPCGQGGTGDLAYVCRGRPDLDILDLDSTERAIAELEPAAVINTSAFTAVDRAEHEPETARLLNATAAGGIAKICSRHTIPLLHISTDYVFGGKADRPRQPDDAIDPASVYGTTKVEGEALVREYLANHVIVRTSWLFGPEGNNFLKTMLKLASQRDKLSIVSDQVGSPTFAPDLADGLCRIVEHILDRPEFDQWGTFHMANEGQTSWYGFAEEIFRQGAAAGLKTPELEPIPSSAYPTDAIRPAYSVLDTGKTAAVFGVSLPVWQNAVKRCLRELRLADRDEHEGIVR